MNRIIVFLLFLVVAVSAVAEVNVTGKVIDRESNEPLVGASVIIKGADSKIKKFASSRSDGGFSITLPSVNCCRLEVAMMSFDLLGGKYGIATNGISHEDVGAVEVMEIYARRTKESQTQHTYQL